MSSVQECDKLARRLFGFNTRINFEERKTQIDADHPIARVNGVRAYAICHVATDPHQTTARVDGDWIMFEPSARTNESAGRFQVAALASLSAKLQTAIAGEELEAAKARVAAAANAAAANAAVTKDGSDAPQN